MYRHDKALTIDNPNNNSEMIIHILHLLRKEEDQARLCYMLDKSFPFRYSNVRWNVGKKGRQMEKSDFFEEISRLGKALDSPERLRILDGLSQAERSVEDLAEALALPVKTVSHHLQKLRYAGFVKFRKEGRFSYYSVSCTGVIALMGNLKSLAVELLPDMKLHMKELKAARKPFRCPDDRNLTDMINSGEFLVIDVRSHDEFAYEHLPGALSVPLDELEDFIANFTGDRTVLAYCSDIFCDLADSAVALLIEAGITSFRLEDSVTARKSEAHLSHKA